MDLLHVDVSLEHMYS